MPLPLVAVGITAAIGAALRAVIPWLVSSLSKVMSSRIGTWCASALAFFGIQWATQTFAMGPIADMIMPSLTGVTGVVLEWCGVMQFDVCITMAVSAIGIKFGLQSARAYLKRR